jgi:surface antigen
VASGDTLGAISSRYGTAWQTLASYNKLANPNVLYIGQRLCIPGKAASNNNNKPNYLAIKGVGNFFPYGQCTWYANYRFHQLRGVYVPWKTNANAWQWVSRAHEFRWRVSSTPTPGTILVLQPWVQGAYGLGHVAVVEQVLGSGRVVASNMNWGANPGGITRAQFRAGAGVSFVSV